MKGGNCNSWRPKHSALGKGIAKGPSLKGFSHRYMVQFASACCAPSAHYSDGAQTQDIKDATPTDDYMLSCSISSRILHDIVDGTDSILYNDNP